jgi:CheY-like chemotaxis protein
MGGAYTVALVGFAENESATFESFFRLAARRPPAYQVQDEVMDAQILIVNSDNLQALHLVQYAHLPGKVLLVGNSDGGTGWALQRKPIKLVAVLAELDRLVGVVPKPTAARPPASAQPAARTGVAAHQPVPAHRGADRGFAATEPYQSAPIPLATPLVPAARPRRRSSDSEFPPTRPMVRSTVAPAAVSAAAVAPPTPMPASPRQQALNARAARPGVMRLTDFGGLDDLPQPTSRSPKSRSPRSTNQTAQAAAPVVPHGDMLLVSESLVEGRILHKRFKKYGLNIDWSREGKQALVMLKAHPYRLVAIDRLNGEPDAYQVCRAAKLCRQPNGQPPVVIMFAPSAGSMDRIKAGLAGGDAYLSRSVAEAEFYKLLAQHRLVELDGFEKTDIGF